jgi:spore coat protein H
MKIKMNWRKSIYLVTLISLMVMPMAGCAEFGDSVSSDGEQIIRPEGWTDETHGSNIDPNYEVVFPQDKVNQIKITITPEAWSAMQANMTELLGGRGPGEQGGQPRLPGVRPDRGGMAPGDISQDGGAAPLAPGIPGWVDMTPENPMWVPATIEFNGLIWTNVGVRYKGNSSLRSGWNSGSLKLPLKLDFDEFEDEHPEIDDQRFYGFKQLSLSNAFSDGTYMRDAIAADILKEAGLVAAETAYYEVILDYGEEPVNLGLYIIIEVIDDTVIDSFFGDDSGNIYEGDGPGVSLAEGTFNLIEESFQKENNEQDADWSDIEALYNVLHSAERTSDPEAWRESLESIFDVGVFLEWLAISAIIQHWDTYGLMAHNFYLYHDPDTDLLTWISWDHNQVLAGDRGGGRGGRAAPVKDATRSVSLRRLGKEETGQDWPLIRYLLDDSVYHERYIHYVEETISGPFNPSKIEKRCEELTELIRPYAAKESREAAFESAVQALINRVNDRYQIASSFLAAGGQ